MWELGKLFRLFCNRINWWLLVAIAARGALPCVSGFWCVASSRGVQTFQC